MPIFKKCLISEQLYFINIIMTLKTWEKSNAPSGSWQRRILRRKSTSPKTTAKCGQVVSRKRRKEQSKLPPSEHAWKRLFPLENHCRRRYVCLKDGVPKNRSCHQGCCIEMVRSDCSAQGCKDRLTFEGKRGNGIQMEIYATKPLGVNTQRDSAAALGHAREQNAAAEQPEFWESATEK